MLEVPDVSIPDNGLGLKLQDKRPLNGPYLRSTGFNIPVMSTNTNPVQRPQSQQKDSSYSRNSKAASMSKGKASERARTRSSVAIEDLVHHLVLQKDETKQSRRLLDTALDKLEVLQKRTVVAEEKHNRETARGARITQTIFEVQEQVTKARQDAEVYKLELEKKQQEIQRQQELVRTIEAERDLAEKKAAKARGLARQLNDERLIALARQEGRKKGFIQGMSQGRKTAVAGRNRAPSSALMKEFDQGVQAPRARPGTPPAEVARRKQEAADAARKEQEAVEAARKAQEAAEVARREQEVARREQQAAKAMRKQFEAVEAARKQFEAIEAARRELEAAKRAAEERVWKDAEEKEQRRQKEALEAERRREMVRAAEREHEQRRISEREAELEREKEALRRQEATRALELEVIMKRQEEKEKELEAQRRRERQLEEERDNERRQREEREAELAHERAKVRELEVEREASSTSSVSHRSQAKRLEYLPMPEPPPFRNPRPGTNSSKPSTPAGTQSPASLHIPPPNFKQPQQFQPPPNGANPRARSHIRRASQSSQETSFSGSGSTSLNNLDIVTFPSAVLPVRLGSHLSDIPEVASDIGRSPAQSVGPGQGNEQSPVDAQMRPVQTRRMESVEQWVHSTAASELNTPTEPATPPMPEPSTWPNPSPHGSNGPPGSTSSGTIHIEVQPPSRPTSLISPTHEDVMFLSPNGRPLQLESNGEAQAQAQRPQQLSPLSLYQNQRRLEPEEPGFVPVIPDLNGDDGIRHLMNFGTPGFIPISITRTNTSEGSSQSTAESERREQAKRAAGGIGSRIYRPSASSSTTSGARSLHAQSQTQTPRMQIYAVPVQSSSTSASQRQSQTPRQTPRQIYSSVSASGSVGSQSNIYGPPQSSRISNIYALPASTTGPQQAPDTVSSTGAGPTPSASGIPAVIPSSPRQPASIYGPPASPRTMPFDPPPSQSSSLQIPASGSDPSIPVIPPSPRRQIYSPNTNGPVIPSSSASGYPYPVSPSSRSGVIPGVGGATPRIYNASLPGMGMNTHTPGGSLAPLPNIAARGLATATPRSNTSALPRGSATPRARSVALEEDQDEDEDEDEDDHDLETRMNTEANRSGRGGVTLQIPP